MPCCAQPSRICSRFHCARTVAVLIDSSAVSGELMTSVPVEVVSSRLHAMHGEQRAHARHCDIGVAQQAGGIGELEKLDQVHETARTLLPTDHSEMLLVVVEPGEEHDAGLVEARGCLEDV